jgi:actin-like protein 6A
VVFDAGSLFIRSGYAGEDSPKVVIPSVSATQEIGIVEPPAGDEKMMDVDGHRVIVGDSITYRRDHMRIESIFHCETGTFHSVANWDYFEQAINFCLQDRLMLDPKDHPMLFADPNIHNRDSRIKLTELMFEKFQVPALYLVKNAVLAR